MDVVIEVTSAVATGALVLSVVRVIVRESCTSTLPRVVTSVTRFLRQGATSLSAVSPDFNLNGGTAAA